MARRKCSLKDTNQSPEVARCLEYVGLFTRVAKAEGVSPSHALQVAKGHRKSKRVIDAIIREVRKIDRMNERAA